MRKSAYITFCGTYRYALGRVWWSELLDEKACLINFIGLNPSTADANLDDPTIRRCIGFTKAWGYNGFAMTNLFAFRATQPEDMKKAADPIGPENDRWLRLISKNSALNVACWGTDGTFMNRADEVKKIVSNLHCIRHTKDGHPEHPLYLPKNLTPILL